MSEYVYLRPKYVGEFQCDGRICPASCCSRHWRILIDNETYKKYSEFEIDGQKITKYLEKNPGGEDFLIVQNENDCCPFLNDEGLCKIQLKYGAENLSQTCWSYPRQLFNFYEVIEISLTPTCPLALDLILNSERIKFETCPVKLPEWMHGQIIVSENFVPEEFFLHIIDLQLTAISILQERRLTIDQRLVILGFYLYQVEQIYTSKNLNALATLNKLYTSEEFFTEQMPMLLDSVKFQFVEFAELMFWLLGKIYGDEKILKTETNEKYIELLEKTFDIKFSDADDFNFMELAEKYYALDEIREIFIKKYSVEFENFLVNDFFGKLYPFKFVGTIQQNYAVFVMLFKIVEIISLAIVANSREDENKTRAEIFKMIGDISMDLNHNENYISAIAESIKEKSDITILMRALLDA